MKLRRRDVLAGAAAASVVSATGLRGMAMEPDTSEWWWSIGPGLQNDTIAFVTSDLRGHLVGREALGEGLFGAMEPGARIKVARPGDGELTDVSQILDAQHVGHPEAVAARMANVEAARRASVWLHGTKAYEWRGDCHVWIEGDGRVVERGPRLLDTRQHPELEALLGLRHRQPIAIRAARIWSSRLKIFEVKVLEWEPRARETTVSA